MPARSSAGKTDGTAFLCLGALSERKNVLRLARAFERHGDGTLTFVGDGALRPALEGRERIRIVGRVGHEDVPTWIAGSDVVCQPSLAEPFGLATLEAMASARSVVATTVGGPPEFVTKEAGVLVDPLDDDDLVDALSQAAALPRPNLAGREAAAEHDVKRAGGAGGGDPAASRSRSASLTSTSGRDRVLEACLARDGERLLVGLAHLLVRDALLQPVVPRDEQFLDALTRVVGHETSVAPLLP